MKDLGLNTVRLEGKMELDEFYDIADEVGMLVFAGWMCCDSWQFWDEWNAEMHWVARESFRTELKRQRIHPSVFLWTWSSDENPPTNVEKYYVEVMNHE